MKFERLTEDGRLWATVYDEETENVFDSTFEKWFDVAWLKSFFESNADDLASFFHITNIDQAVFDTLDDATELHCLILDLSPDTELDHLFRPLENWRAGEALLSRERAKGHHFEHPSWLRLYAIRLESNRYIITGGAIKLTATMKERTHTLHELERQNRVRDFLIAEGIIDYNGLNELNHESSF